MFTLRYLIILALISSSCLAAPPGHIHRRGHPGGNWGGGPPVAVGSPTGGAPTFQPTDTDTETAAAASTQQPDFNADEYSRPSEVASSPPPTTTAEATGGAPSGQQGRPSNVAAGYAPPNGGQASASVHDTPNSVAAASAGQTGGASPYQHDNEENKAAAYTAPSGGQQGRPSAGVSNAVGGNQQENPNNNAAAYTAPSGGTPHWSPSEEGEDSGPGPGGSAPQEQNKDAAAAPHNWGGENPEDSSGAQPNDDCTGWGKRWDPPGGWQGHAGWLGHHAQWEGPPGGQSGNPCIPSQPPATSYTAPSTTYTNPPTTQPQSTQPSPSNNPPPNTSPSPSPTTQSGTTPTTTQSGYMGIVNEWRSAMGHATLTMDTTLQGNAQKTVDDDQGTMNHELNPGTMAQVLAPGNADNFENVYVGGWLCEEPNEPGLNGICSSMSSGWSYDGTGHADILNSDGYKNIGCALADGLWGCDLS